MNKTVTDKTIRLKKQEASDLKDLSFELTKKAITAGHQKIYKESDIVHFLIENLAKAITVNSNGDLELNIDSLK
ncbi:hypothetical protein A6B39_04305 [Mannheimia granulomatis]|uniref:hypothetical protein n=1 Tax=Mannheimia granulomatis TaxID=85402 RepID=UPI00159DFC10|nr:hypothetical protein [Mannheimia granulomatis]QLB14719.1 hypothetical protein A6B39_04260 [Mannheimia granulomatis]QLB14728.1 hypothetical protein A6B39_04305 [Mannheimia granulomatis]